MNPLDPFNPFGLWAQEEASQEEDLPLAASVPARPMTRGELEFSAVLLLGVLLALLLIIAKAKRPRPP